MPKEFKTNDELVEILRSRGVITDEDTKPAIERESYYAIVNGYKKPFLDHEAMKTAPDDVYLEGTRFEWIYDLFKFDRDLRTITFEYLTRAEAVMRTAVAYAFCESHGSPDAYLGRSSFCNPDDYLVPRKFKGDKTAHHRENLSRLMKLLNGKVSIDNDTRDFIRHYANRHGGVPLWVLVNDLTFGNIVHFYQLMQPRDRRRVCSIVASVSNRDLKRHGFLNEVDLLRSIRILNDFRNYCAHDERLYCAKSHGANYSDMLVKLTDVITMDEVRTFTGEITHLHASYNLHNMEFGELLEEMGFDPVGGEAPNT